MEAGSARRMSLVSWQTVRGNSAPVLAVKNMVEIYHTLHRLKRNSVGRVANGYEEGLHCP